MEVDAADLWRLPVFAAVARALELEPARINTPQQLRASFKFDASAIRFSDIQFMAGAITLYGDGEISLSGEVSLRLDAVEKFARRRRLPVLDSLFGVLVDMLAVRRSKVEVFGTLTEPAARATLVGLQ